MSHGNSIFLVAASIVLFVRTLIEQVSSVSSEPKAGVAYHWINDRAFFISFGCYGIASSEAVRFLISGERMTLTGTLLSGLFLLVALIGAVSRPFRAGWRLLFLSSLFAGGVPLLFTLLRHR